MNFNLQSSKWRRRFALKAPLISRLEVPSKLRCLLVIVSLGFSALSCDMSQAASINDVFALVAIGVPEFAGVHVDEQQDTVYVHLRNGTPGMAQTVLAQLRSFFGEHTLPQHKMQVMSAGFTFSELKRWHDQIIVNVLDHP